MIIQKRLEINNDCGNVITVARPTVKPPCQRTTTKKKRERLINAISKTEKFDYENKASQQK